MEPDRRPGDGAGEAPDPAPADVPEARAEPGPEPRSGPGPAAVPDLDVPAHRLAVDRHAEARPEAPALLAVDALGNVVRRTHAEVAEASRRIAAHLRDGEGVGRGDRVALVLPQRVEALLVHLACSRLGAIACPVSPLFGTTGLADRLADARPAVVVTGRDDLGKVEEAVAALPDAPEAPPPPVRDVDDPGVEAAWFGADPLPEADEVDVGGDDPGWLVYTSGTTSRPRGVVLPHRVLAGRMPGFETVHPGFGPGRLFYTPADWAWIGGLLDACLAPLAAGGAVLAHARRTGFDAAAAAELMADRGVTHAFLAPTALKALAREGDRLPDDLALASVHSAGEPLPRPLAEWARSTLCDEVGNVYGLTEAAFLIGTTTRDDGVPIDATGRPFPHAVVDLRDDEVVVGAATPTLMLGYWRGPDRAPKLPLDDDDGWFRTGDLAERRGDGGEPGDGAGDAIYWVRERKDDLINTAGHLVGPAEVEACLLDHPGVAEAAVVGAPDPDRGQVVVAYVVADAHVDPGPELEADVQEFVRRRLAAHAYPREVRFVEALPRGPTGKVRRRELGEEHPGGA